MRVFPALFLLTRPDNRLTELMTVSITAVKNFLTGFTASRNDFLHAVVVLLAADVWQSRQEESGPDEGPSTLPSPQSHHMQSVGFG